MTSAIRSAVAPATADRSRRPSWRRRERLTGLLAVTPAVVLVAGFMLYPIGYALWISFNHSDGVVFDWVGVQNYIDLLSAPVLRQVFGTNLLMLLSVPLVITTSLICSILLYERVWGWRSFRLIYFVPNVLSTAVVGLIFKSVFGYSGPVNALLVAAGLPRIDFFAHAGTAIFVIILALVWSGFGYQNLILLSGLTSINPEIFEAASLDGAGWWRRLLFVTLPNLRGPIALVSILNIVYTFTSLFGFIFVMTAGGPGYDTTTLDYFIYSLAFSSSNMGEGAALAVMVFVLIGVLTLVQLRLFRVAEED